MTANQNAVIIVCNEAYIPYAIVSLALFCSHNKGYDKFIIGKSFSSRARILAQKDSVKLLEADLSKDFINLDKRPYGRQYPIECFYHLYAYKLLPKHKFIIQIEPDVYTNRTLDLNLNKIKYLAGSQGGGKVIANSFRNDREKILKLNPKADFDQNAKRSGFTIYNTAGLQKIKFYEKIVEYYQKSWEIGAPRCGDDSLLMLYQSFHKDHVLLLDQAYNFLSNNPHEEDYTNYYHCHSVSSDKWWTGKVPTNDVERYYNEKFVEYLYNHFNPIFIKRFFPALYVDIGTVEPIKFFYMKKGNNFGDLITPYLLKRFCKSGEYVEWPRETTHPKIISCGSIMRLSNPKTIVYGSGIRDIDQDITPGITKIVRGPLTRKRIIEVGGKCHPIYGDPGLLMPLIYSPSIKKKYMLGIIPHVSQYQQVSAMYGSQAYVTVIKLENENIEETIDWILSCKKIVSSSLHGLIISDAYNIPNKWIQFADTIRGDGTKFQDYFLSVKRADKDFIDAIPYKLIPVRTLVQAITPVVCVLDKQRLLDNMFFTKTGIKPYTKYLMKTIQA